MIKMKEKNMLNRINEWADRNTIRVLIFCGVIVPIFLAIHAILTGKGQLTLEGLYQVTIKDYWEALTT